MAAYTQLTFLFCSILVLTVSVSGQTTGTGINFCTTCGNNGNTTFNASTISRCTLKEPDTTNITNSLFQCECKDRFAGDGITCDDENECAQRTDNCDRNALCTNTFGSFSCACKPGWNGTGTECENINECLEADADKKYCNDLGDCQDTQGSWTCGCKGGYTLNSSKTGCIDINECDVNNGRCEQQCINMVGKFSCSCYSGYEEKDPNSPGVNCETINECERLVNPCGNNAHCHDTNGSYYCACNKGFKWDGNSLRRHCIDINECAEGRLNCDKWNNTECHNSYGSAECVCQEGWRGLKEKCENINECVENTAKCDANADCSDNVDGGYICKCKGGFTGDGLTCDNVDECANGTATCDRHAKCVDTPGSYDCNCIYGFEGDGKTCQVKKYNGKDINTVGNRIAKSRAIYQLHLLDHQRMQLELEHEILMRRCAHQVQEENLKSRGRREIIDVSAKDAQSAEAMIVILKKNNADLALENHALGISCPE